MGPELAQSSWRFDLAVFMRTFGQLFQFSDDLLDVIGSEDKEAWVDLKEGKLNFITWQLLDRRPELTPYLQQHFEQKHIPEDVVRQVERAVSKDFVAEMRERLGSLAKQAIQCLCYLPDSRIRSAAEGLVDLCVDRTR